jgi:hypothetical protein
MAKEYIKKYLRWKPEVIEIYEELDKYREFCVDYGRAYDEKELGNERSQNWIDYQRLQRGKFVRNHWDGPPKKEFKPRDNSGRGYNNYRQGYSR